MGNSTTHHGQHEPQDGFSDNNAWGHGDVTALYPVILEHSQDIITVSKLDGTFVYLTPSVQTALGYLPSELVGRTRDDWYHPEDVSHWEQVRQQIMEGKDQGSFTCRLRRKGGGYGWFEVRFCAVRDGSGAVQWVISFARDVTERRELEMALRRSRDKLSHAQRIAKIGYWEWDAQQQSLYWSDEMYAIWGLPPGQFVGTMEAYLSTIHPEDRDYVSRLMRAGMEGFRPFDTQFRILLPDGSIRHIQALGDLDRDVAGRLLRMFGTVQDVTERKLAELRLRTAEEQLRKSERLAALGHLAAGIAHEIRNPLTTLKGFTQLLQGSVNPDKQSFLRIMLDELTQIERIVNDLVLLAKPAGAEGRAQRMVDILERAMQETEPEAAAGGVRMEMRAPSESPWVKCSPGQLSQMFCNILRNAVQAMPNGGVIQIVVTEAADWVVVQIIDEGTGIPDERLPHLGEPFFTTKERGTGLGLMVSYRIAEAHGGRIDIESQVGRGTTVTVSLPRLGGQAL
ncbi:hypothetical protein GCM10025857_17190 [Alicyclobacillus contaminans]|uniref:PAS domain-containing protein n=1 Tax=Alicyclobacillus contaminans TaxID=392016 RepID=UPI00047A661E|nr:PAS domain-containing protein [Alicyclobacillus contaminans]GMA50362.1 hypothetical protein GCM10025857_17190 [Alicyclobacillus contaminans]